MEIELVVTVKFNGGWGNGSRAGVSSTFLQRKGKERRTFKKKNNKRKDFFLHKKQFEDVGKGVTPPPPPICTV